MSEGYQCDRCGSTHGGSPDTTVALGDGIPRQRETPALVNEVYEEVFGPYDNAVDLCPACRADLRQWWVEAGGDVTEVARDVE